MGEEVTGDAEYVESIDFSGSEASVKNITVGSDESSVSETFGTPTSSDDLGLEYIIDEKEKVFFFIEDGKVTEISVGIESSETE